MLLLAVFVLLAPWVFAAHYEAPAGIRPAIRRPGAASILPGGRIIAPLGRQYPTGPGPFGIAVSPDGKTIVSANGGPHRYSLTVLERDKKSGWQVRHLVAPLRKEEMGRELEKGEAEGEWHSIFMGLAFANDRTVYASEGNSGRVRLVDLASGSARKIFDLNQEDFKDSYTGDLAFDPTLELLWVIDQANFRLVGVDTRRGRIVSSTRLGRLPFAIALSPDKRHAWVTNIGMFEYKPVPGADPKLARETGLLFPAFGFPSPESRNGARRDTASGPVAVPGLGDPNVRESNSVCAVNLEDASHPHIEAFVRTGMPFGGGSYGGSSPSGVVASADRVFVSNAHNDSITVIDARTNAVAGEIPIRIPQLESLRGALPIGLAYDEPTGWLLAAEAGINAVAVIDTRQMRLLGHLPVAWFPTRIAVDRDTLYVANARGQGTGPNMNRAAFADGDTFLGAIRRGTISVIPLPAASEISGHTSLVLEGNGFL